MAKITRIFARTVRQNLFRGTHTSSTTAATPAIRLFAAAKKTPPSRKSTPIAKRALSFGALGLGLVLGGIGVSGERSTVHTSFKPYPRYFRPKPATTSDQDGSKNPTYPSKPEKNSPFKDAIQKATVNSLCFALNPAVTVLTFVMAGKTIDRQIIKAYPGIGLSVFSNAMLNCTVLGLLNQEVKGKHPVIEVMAPAVGTAVATRFFEHAQIQSTSKSTAEAFKATAKNSLKASFWSLPLLFAVLRESGFNMLYNPSGKKLNECFRPGGDYLQGSKFLFVAALTGIGQYSVAQFDLYVDEYPTHSTRQKLALLGQELKTNSQTLIKAAGIRAALWLVPSIITAEFLLDWVQRKIN